MVDFFKYFLAWPVARVLFFAGEIASRYVYKANDNLDEKPMLFDFFFLVYQWSMIASDKVDEWGRTGLWFFESQQ